MLTIPIIGINNPPGTRNDFSKVNCGLLLNLIVANITDRYTIKIAPLARLANCLNPPVIEKRKIKLAYVITAICGVKNLA